MTRVISGSVGGRRLDTPKGDGTRPTSDRVRESLFSSLQSLLGGFDGLRVLDLYAGSGALGIEALSRGAAEAVLVESDARAAGVVRRNVSGLGLRGRVVQSTVQSFLTSLGPSTDGFAVVFCDPPYARPVAAVERELGLLVPALLDDAIVVVERSSRTPDLTWPDGLEAVRDKAYGETRLWYGRPHG